MSQPDSPTLFEKRHSLSHILAQAVLDMFPEAKLAIGPPIDNGFYYDFDLPRTLIPEDLEILEKKMRHIIKQNQVFEQYNEPVDQAIEFLKKINQDYKVELAADLKEKGEGELGFYKNGPFVDMCKGPHVKSTNQIDPQSFTLDKVAGAYWKGDSERPMLQRIYGLAFETKAELDDYLNMRKEAEKRDHRKIGKELQLFTTSPLVGMGLPMLLPKGETIKEALWQFIRSEKEKRGYSFVSIPHIAKAQLYEKSGHLGKYDAMMPLMTDDEGDQFCLKAMNCPHHFEMYNSWPHSYRDLPLRLAENTTCYRNEKSGELSGLVRVKNLTQDDTHHFVRTDQIADEIEMVLGLMKKVYHTFGFEKYTVQISLRDPEKPENYFGDDKTWKHAEDILVKSVKEWGAPYVIEEGEAAFYGPKIDIMVEDAIGRSWQLTTVQLDFIQPENFDMTYTDEHGNDVRPAVLHVAIYGSFERFMGILIEHFAGAFPTWLSPVQAVILPVADVHAEYAKKVQQTLAEKGVRTEMVTAEDSLGKRIRNAEKQKIPYMLVIGDKETESNEVTARSYKIKEQNTYSLDDFVMMIEEEIKERKL